MPRAATCRSRRTPFISAWGSVRRSTGRKSAGPAAGRSGSTTLPSILSTAAPSLQATREHEATGRRARGLSAPSPPPRPRGGEGRVRGQAHLDQGCVLETQGLAQSGLEVRARVNRPVPDAEGAGAQAEMGAEQVDAEVAFLVAALL